MPAARSPRSRSTARFTAAQKPESFRRWHDDTPDGFVFSVKGPRFATHREGPGGGGPMDRTVSGERLSSIHAASSARSCGSSRPFLRFDEAGFEAFLALLPHQVDSRGPAPCRRGAACEDFGTRSLQLLGGRHRVAVALVDDEKYPGDRAPHRRFCLSSRCAARCSRSPGPAIRPEALDAWAGRARRLAGAAQGGDCFIYFINGAKVRAPAAAAALLSGLQP